METSNFQPQDIKTSSHPEEKLPKIAFCAERGIFTPYPQVIAEDKMPKSSTVTPWLGAPPVSEDGFTFVNGEFFAESSGQHQHRRATHAELKAHFTSGSDKDHPAHWFEAQLIHYGLQPSKTKSVARMRLFDAVNAGKLVVPAHIAKLEGKLKKEWTKKDREAKKEPKGESRAETKSTMTTENEAGAKKKRKADDNIGSMTDASKKAKTAEPRKPVSKVASSTKATTTKPTKKQTARRGGISKASSRDISTTLLSPAPAPRPKQTARRSGAFMARGRISTPQAQVNHNYDDFDDHEPPPQAQVNHYDYYGFDDHETAPRPKQTARRSGAFMARGRISAPQAHYDYDDFDDHEPPPPYSEYHEDSDTEMCW
ncbi:hypothetical protein B7463_g5831, partial [Scytalidium lignicola]